MTMPPALPAPFGIPPSNLSAKLTEIIRRAGANATFAAQEFFCDTIRNEHTRRAYLQAVKQLLAWVEKHGGEELACRWRRKRVPVWRSRRSQVRGYALARGGRRNREGTPVSFSQAGLSSLLTRGVR